MFPSALSAKVGLQHGGHREGEDQAGAVRAGAGWPVIADRHPQALSVTGVPLLAKYSVSATMKFTYIISYYYEPFRTHS